MYGKYMITARNIIEGPVCRFFIPAASPEEAAAPIPIYYQITEVKDVTKKFPIYAGRVFAALEAAGFSFEEESFIIRLLCEFGMIYPRTFMFFTHETLRGRVFHHHLKEEELYG